MNSRCAKIQFFVPLALDGDVDENTRAKVLEHVRGCAACAEAYAFQSRLREALGDDPAPSAPPVYFEGVLAEIHRRMPVAPARILPAARRRIHRQSLASAVAAALALLWIGATFAPHAAKGLELRGAVVSYFSVASAGPEAQAGHSVRAAVKLAAIQGIGLIRADSPILKMPAYERRELGLPSKIVAVTLSSVLSKG